MVALIVVLTFIVFIVISSLLQKKEITDSIEDVAVSFKRARLPFPNGYFFSPNHTWVSLENSGNLTVGIDELIQRFVGKVNSIKLKNSGDYVMKGEELLSVDKDGVKISITSPVSGKIECANFEMDQNPQKLNDDPYQTCWLYSIKPTHLSNDIKTLKIAEQAKNWLTSEFNRLKDFVQASQTQPALSHATLSDGGVLVDGISDYVSHKTIKEFEQKFLKINNEDQ